MRAFLVLAAAIVSFTLAPVASAQNAADANRFDLTVSPVFLTVSTTPGSTTTQQVKVRNGSTATEGLSVSLMKFKAYSDNGQPELLPFEPNDDYATWASFSENQFTVAPGEWKTINVTFTVPPTAGLGYYYAVNFTRTNNPQPADEGTTLIGSAAVLILLDVAVPEAERRVELVEFSADHKLYAFLPSTFTLRLKNTGNIHVAPHGNVFIQRSDGKQVTLLNINERLGNILPNSERVFTAVWEDGFPLYVPKIENEAVVHNKKGEVEMKLKWDFSQTQKLRFGKYTANALLVFDDGTRDIPIEGTVSFWVVPWPVLLIVLVVLYFSLSGIYHSIKRRLIKRLARDKT